MRVAWLNEAPIVKDAAGKITGGLASVRYRCIIPQAELKERGVESFLLEKAHIVHHPKGRIQRAHRCPGKNKLLRVRRNDAQQNSNERSESCRKSCHPVRVHPAKLSEWICTPKLCEKPFVDQLLY